MSDRRPHIDTMRGVAVLSVLVFHLDHLELLSIPGAAAGWVGVDVFFGASGFILAKAHARNPGRWLLRRLARVYPLHLVVVALAAIAGAPLYPELLVPGLGAYTQRAPLMLAPSWSLLHEEVWYLTMPWLRTTHALHLLFWAAVALRVATGALAEVAEVHWYFGARLDPMVAGALVARGHTLRLSTLLVVGLGSAAAAVCSLVPLAGALMSLFVGLASARVAGMSRAWTWAPLEWCGRRCYALYLLQYPVLLELGLWGVPALFVLAELSWWTLELPFMRAVSARRSP